MLRLIRFYQRWVSPILPPRCRFIPTCSEYAAEAIDNHGLTRGGALAVQRLCKCHPFHPGGFDPVPMEHTPSAACKVVLVKTDQDRIDTQNPVDQ